MKICWDNLEGLHLTKYGNFCKGSATYVEKESCCVCGDHYLMNKNNPTTFCSKHCSIFSNPIYNKNKQLSSEHKSNLSISQLKRFKNKDNHPRWKGGVYASNKPLYSTYFDKLRTVDEVGSFVDGSGLLLLKVKCAYCGRWFIPSMTSVSRRLRCLSADVSYRTFGEGRFYCSSGCKSACPTFGRHKFPKGFKIITSREVQPDLRKLVLKRDNYTCQKCGSINVELHCHHITGINLNPIESADLDNCISLCKSCHKEVHKMKGCNYNDLKCKEEVL